MVNSTHNFTTCIPDYWVFPIVKLTVVHACYDQDMVLFKCFNLDCQDVQPRSVDVHVRFYSNQTNPNQEIIISKEPMSTVALPSGFDKSLPLKLFLPGFGGNCSAFYYQDLVKSLLLSKVSVIRFTFALSMN